MSDGISVTYTPGLERIRLVRCQGERWGQKGRKRRAAPSGDALSHEATGLIKGPRIENKGECDVFLKLKIIVWPEGPLRLRVSVKTTNTRQKCEKAKTIIQTVKGLKTNIKTAGWEAKPEIYNYMNENIPPAVEKSTRCLRCSSSF